MVNPSQVREPAVQVPRCEITAFPCSHVCPKASFPRAWGGGQAPLPVGEQRSLLDGPPGVVTSLCASAGWPLVLLCTHAVPRCLSY